MVRQLAETPDFIAIDHYNKIIELSSIDISVINTKILRKANCCYSDYYFLTKI